MKEGKKSRESRREYRNTNPFNHENRQKFLSFHGRWITFTKGRNRYYSEKSQNTKSCVAGRHHSASQPIIHTKDLIVIHKIRLLLK